MLDSGSFCNFITEKLVNKLKLNIQKTKNKILVKGISGRTIKLDPVRKARYTNTTNKGNI